MMRSALQKSGAFASKTMTKPSPIGSVRGMAKEIKFGVDGRAAMLKGVDTLADAVQVRSQKISFISTIPIMPGLGRQEVMKPSFLKTLHYLPF